ncbi:MAG: hypothetical protein M1812_007181 [Candelaria pacifica]|nr:MAG: hypothetical protein M1812_007181 [Candelaria pacifica]
MNRLLEHGSPKKQSENDLREKEFRGKELKQSDNELREREFKRKRLVRYNSCLRPRNNDGRSRKQNE